jgi:hypothetical protein
VTSRDARPRMRRQPLSHRVKEFFRDEFARGNFFWKRCLAHDELHAMFRADDVPLAAA